MVSADARDVRWLMSRRPNHQRRQCMLQNGAARHANASEASSSTSGYRLLNQPALIFELLQRCFSTY